MEHGQKWLLMNDSGRCINLSFAICVASARAGTTVERGGEGVERGKREREGRERGKRVVKERGEAVGERREQEERER